MESDTRRLLTAMLVALGIFIAYQYVINLVFPPRQPAPVTTEPAAPSAPAAPSSAGPSTTAAEQPPTPSTAPRQYTLTAGVDGEPIVLGGQPGDALRVTLNPHGGGLATIELTARDSKGRIVHRSAPKRDEPYQLLAPVDDGRRVHYSFATHEIWIEQRGQQLWNQSWRLDELPWIVAERAAQRAVFTTTLRGDNPPEELLRLTKTYVLRPGKPIIDLELVVDNLAGESLKIRLEQDGPLGIRQENQQYDMRRLLVAQMSSNGVELGRGRQYSDLQKAALSSDDGALPLLRLDKGPLLWTALTNKYFAVYTRPLPRPGQNLQDLIIGASGLVVAPHAAALPGDLWARGDLLARLATRPVELAPATAARYAFEIYSGPKDAENLRRVDALYADKNKLYYQLAQSADTRCFCTFLWLEELMVWLLAKIHLVVRNYGVAIIILVIIVRTLLHPLTVFQQKSMFRMQEAMGRIQPKMEEIKQKFANDKVRQNQEMMKLFAEEGVNPAANFVAFLPLLIQMPILVALWTGLNTDINLRHAPFDGWWIKDLSAPDALLPFDPPITVPILGWLPLIGSWFSGVSSLNLLPIIMGVSMWLQQKYMPKPQLKDKNPGKASPSTPAAKPRSGLSPEQQLRQQQIMAYMMAVLFPLMFYRMPSGLNLYWLSTNVFGIAESLIIRRQIERERKLRQELGPPPPRRKTPGLLGRFFRHIASRAEELQRKADELSRADEASRHKIQEAQRKDKKRV